VRAARAARASRRRYCSGTANRCPPDPLLSVSGRALPAQPEAGDGCQSQISLWSCKRRTGVEPATSSLGSSEYGAPKACKTAPLRITTRAVTAGGPQNRSERRARTVTNGARSAGTPALAQWLPDVRGERCAQFVGRFGHLTVFNNRPWNFRLAESPRATSVSETASSQRWCYSVALSSPSPGITTCRIRQEGGFVDESRRTVVWTRPHDGRSRGVSRCERANPEALYRDGTSVARPASRRPLSGVEGVLDGLVWENKPRQWRLSPVPHASAVDTSGSRLSHWRPCVESRLRPLARITCCSPRTASVTAMVAFDREKAHHG